MAEFPALPLWTDAFIADTTHLTAEETGAYLMLLMVAWRRPECDLPDDDAMLQRWSRVAPARWRKIRDRVRSFWTIDGGRLIQKRLKQERDFVSQKCELQSKKAKARWLKQKESGGATAMPGQCTHTHTHTISVEDKSSTGAGAPSSPSAPDLTPEPDLFGAPPEPAPAPAPAAAAPKAKPAPAPVNHASAPALAAGAPRTLEQRVYDLGRQVIPGKRSGGQVTRLRRHFGGDLDATLRCLEFSATKSDPPAYIAAIIRGSPAERAESVLAETDRLYRQWGVS